MTTHYSNFTTRSPSSDLSGRHQRQRDVNCQAAIPNVLSGVSERDNRAARPPASRTPRRAKVQQRNASGIGATHDHGDGNGSSGQQRQLHDYLHGQ
jgi:hypothetical protein